MYGNDRTSYKKVARLPAASCLKRFFTNSKISHIAILFLVLFLLFHYFTDHFLKLPTVGLQSESNSPYSSHRSRDLKHIDELNRIKKSVSNELRNLESKRNQIQSDISMQQSSLSNAEQQIKKAQSELEKLKREIVQLKNEQREAAKPKMVAPARLLASEEDNIDIEAPIFFKRCTMNDCFDYSRCSLTSQFPVYVYSFDQADTDESPFATTAYIIDAVKNAFVNIPYRTSDPSTACLYVVILGEVESLNSLYSEPKVDPGSASKWLQSLRFWRGDGRNHLLVYLTRQTTVQNPLLSVDTGRAMVAQSNFGDAQFRFGFDIVIPTLTVTGLGHRSVNLEQEVDHVMLEEWKSEDEAWMYEEIPLQAPAIREYVLTFQGQIKQPPDVELINEQIEMEKEPPPSSYRQVFVDSLKFLRSSKFTGKFLIETECGDDKPITPGYRSEWGMCGSLSSRAALLSRSTFALVPPPEPHSGSSVSTSLFLNRLAEALRVGAIPIIPGTSTSLPFSEYIEWEKACIVIPPARITELSLLLNSLPHEDILALRRQGRFIFQTYFSSTTQVIKSLLALVRGRLQIPALPVDDAISNVLDHESFKISDHEPSPGDAKSEFGYPPSEPRIDSKMFRHNYTTVLVDIRDTWNSAPGPFRLFPFQPKDRSLPTDAQFIGSSDGFRPIGGGWGGTGRVYQESLGGNHPREQFTVVMLTYERNDVLIQAIERLSELPHLNKVVVVWNSPTPPSDDLHWPDIGVEVAVVLAEKNSLNNRFVPWDAIKTEAVLSIDDDAHLRHDEILFGFRVWRQNRDRVVGFPGRFHAWDERNDAWAYNSNHTCELSMVLTGAAFFHKYYMYLYTYWLPPVLRDTVDEYMNCEDIAMNFLVSHVTRQPPVKVTSRWTFRCPGCPVALSQSEEHFLERHKCINQFVKIFGYMPLIYTQFRVDSILFKTRLPHDKQKCFKYI